MINFPLYREVATAMQRLGLQPISQEEILANRRQIHGRRKTDGLGSFLLDHFILDGIEFLVLVLLYTLIHG